MYTNDFSTNPFNAKILPEAVFIIYFYFCAMSIQKKAKALASLPCFLQKKSFQWQNITRSCFDYLFLLLCHEHSKKSKGLGVPSKFFAKKILSMAKYYQKLSKVSIAAMLSKTNVGKDLIEPSMKSKPLQLQSW